MCPEASVKLLKLGLGSIFIHFSRRVGRGSCWFQSPERLEHLRACPVPGALLSTEVLEHMGRGGGVALRTASLAVLSSRIHVLGLSFGLG